MALVRLDLGLDLAQFVGGTVVGVDGPLEIRVDRGDLRQHGLGVLPLGLDLGRRDRIGQGRSRGQRGKDESGEDGECTPPQATRCSPSPRPVHADGTILPHKAAEITRGRGRRSNDKGHSLRNHHDVASCENNKDYGAEKNQRS